MDGKVGGETGRAVSQVVLVDPNGALCIFLLVVVLGDQLEIDILMLNKLLERFRELVVQFLEAGFESMIGDMFVYF